MAELIPFRERDSAKVRSAIDTLRAFQETHSLGGLSVRRNCRGSAQVLMPFVLDCSVAMAWVFPDEATEATARLRDSLIDDLAFVPSLWVCNPVRTADGESRDVTTVGSVISKAEGRETLSSAVTSTVDRAETRARSEGRRCLG